MAKAGHKKYGRRKAGTYGRVHGPTRGNSKRAASKATRRAHKQLDEEFSSMPLLAALFKLKA